MNINALQQKLPKITLLLLVVVMIAALSLQAYYIFAPISNEPSDQTQAIKQAVKEVRPTRDIKKYQLFGTPSSASTQKTAAKTDNLPKTNLRLILRGVSASDNTNDNNAASALIEGPNKETLKYSINNTLPGNAKLRSVYEKRIVIERNGRLENLYFPDSKSIGIVSSTSSTDSSSPQTPYQPASTVRASSIPSTVPKAHIPQNFSRPATNLDTLSDQRKQEIKERLQQLREKMKQAQ